MADELNLNRNFMHTQFSSWRLQQLATVKCCQLCATGHASGVATTALDFLHTHASVLRNHLLLSEGRLFVFTQSEKKVGYFIYELLPAPTCDQGLLPLQMAELGPDAAEASAGGAVEAVVDCSLAVVAELEGPTTTIRTSAPDAAPALALSEALPEPLSLPPPQQQQQILLSRGHGDIVLMRRQGNNVSYSNAVYPLRPNLPYTGVRPLILEAAVVVDNGDITAVVWAMRSKDPHRAACCELFAVTLRPREGVVAPTEGLSTVATAAGGSAAGAVSAGLQLSTVHVQLLVRTRLPPYLVRVMPTRKGAEPGSSQRGRVLLVGLDPNTAGLEDEEMEGGGACGIGGRTEELESGRSGGNAAVVDDDDDDMDPRTLEQAAARLAHLTAEDLEGVETSRPQWADLYKESGPDGLGALGDEPALDLVAWRLGSSGSEGACEGAAGGGDSARGPVDPPLVPFWRLCCGAHRLMTAEGPVRITSYHGRSQPHQPHNNCGEAAPLQPLLLGVTDDVDCAVLRVECRQPMLRGPGSSEAPDVQQHHEQEDEAQLADGLQVRHALSVPALAYVAAGKTYKRHLLLTSAATSSIMATSGRHSGGSRSPTIAAVIVESQRFMYLYGTTTTNEEYGKQQVVELGLEEGERVLGARLVEVEAGEGGGLDAALEGEGLMVVIATQRRLLSYRLTAR